MPRKNKLLLSQARGEGASLNEALAVHYVQFEV